MKAMILAAGRGERMRPLTDDTPKPLLQVQGKALIEYHLELLSQLGITDVVINHAWLGEQFPQKLGDGSAYGVNIHYSAESNGALETAGGIIKALPFLLSKKLFENKVQEPFLVINGDVFLAKPLMHLPELANDKLAHLWLVENPAHNTQGDFYLSNGRVSNALPTKELASNEGSEKAQRLTFSGIAMYRPEFFMAIANELQKSQQQPQQKLALGPALRSFADQNLISGELLNVGWTDVGTPDRLAQLNQQAV